MNFDWLCDFFVDESQQGKRIDKVLVAYLNQSYSRAFIQKIIEDGGLFCNGVCWKACDGKVCLNDHIQLKKKDLPEVKLQPRLGALSILYEDENLLVVDKPEGQVVHPGNGVEAGTTLVESVLAHCPLAMAAGSLRPGVVHRIDQATSGIVLFAKTDLAYWNLVKMFAERSIRKTYHALVWNVPRLLSGSIEAPIGRSHSDRTSMCIRQDGRYALTSWKRMEVFEKSRKALLECHPHTGRTHQLRVHLKSIGHTIVGDPKYGKVSDKRLFLHAYQVEFVHPITMVACLFRSEWPQSFDSEIQKLRAFESLENKV